MTRARSRGVRGGRLRRASGDALGGPARPVADPKAAAISTVEQNIASLERLLSELRDWQAGATGHPPILLAITRRCAEVESELLDQRLLVAHLRAANVTVKPMSQEAQRILTRLLEALDECVRKDQALHRVLELADVIVGLANDHEHEIKELTT